MATATKSAAVDSCAVSKAQLVRFVNLRNKSGFSSNLQFGFDASECGFDVNDLGRAYKREAGGYRWYTDHGTLIEHANGQMELVPPGERELGNYL